MKLINEINSIKILREEFLNNFSLDSSLQSILKEVVTNNNLNSIRIHKYLTNAGLIGKVKAARFLESIELTEKTKIKDLNDVQIEEIDSFVGKI
jgi:hypothetical protein